MRATTGDLLAGRYRLEDRRGRGGMAEVFAAADEVLERRVAVKVLADELAAEPAAVERFQREARAAARLSHPRVVAVFDAASDDGVHFIVMELLEGPTLADRLRREGPLPVGEALRVAAAIGEALRAAHHAGLVHRDVKPSNVIFTADGRPKVTDFGIAGASQASTTVTATVRGSVPYLAPEQARGAPPDPRSDLYGLGCVLFEMLTGRPPFTAETSAAVLSQHLHNPPPVPSSLRSEIPEDLDRLVLTTLAKEPGGRYPDAEALVGDLERVAAGRAPTRAAPSATLPLPTADPTAPVSPDAADDRPASPAPPPPPTGGRRPRGRTLALGAALLAAGAVLAALIFAGSGDPSGQADPAGDAAASPSPTPASPTAPPPTTPPAEPSPTSPEEALVSIRGVLAEGRAAGQISAKAVDEIEEALSEVLDKRDEDDERDEDDAPGRGRGRGQKNDDELAKKVEEVRGKVDDLHDEGEITTSLAAELGRQLDMLEDTLV